jgi:hypothetical protein
MKTVFLRALEADDKAAALRNAAAGLKGAGSARRFDVVLESLRQVPGSPFSYWVTQKLLSVFQRLPTFDSHGRKARAGAATIDDVRFVRHWFEIEGRSWVPLAKGGKNAPFYADIHLVVQWSDDGAELKAFAGAYRERKGWGDQWTAVLNGYGLYFRPGLTWPHRSATFSVAPLPAGCIFTKSGKAAFAPDDQLGLLLAILNAASATMLLRVQSDAVRIKFEAGLVERLPIPDVGASESAQLKKLSRRAWSLKRCLDTRTEISHAFMFPALLQVTGDTLTARAVAWDERARAIDAELAAIQTEIDARCFDLYGIDEADRRAITEGFGSTIASAGTAETDTDTDAESESEADDEDEAESNADTTTLAAELVSWAVGVAFGRFDVRLTTGARDLPPEPEPFDPLPVCSPAMLTGDDGLPLGSAPASYPLAFPENGILVDDPGHAHDLTTAVRTVFDVVFGARADRIWEEMATLLDPKDHDLQAWLSASFFEHHFKRHSKSRRKAPILWQLGTPSGRYSVWLYAHRLTRDSAFQLQNDVVTPKLIHEERQLTSLVQRAGGSPSATERKEIATQETFVEELRTLLDEVKRVAPLWTPMLDDGAVLTMAPLWRLVPQYKPWQKELKGKWDELCAGKYNWAYLAMHLWPERVVPNCAIDRSLAIAHGLEDVFWVQGGDGKWKPRSMPSRSVDELIRERTSPAVKAALTSLLEAPYAMSGNSRGRGRRTGAAAIHGGTR